jgi:predicted amidohydrolase YtcJ
MARLVIARRDGRLPELVVDGGRLAGPDAARRGDTTWWLPPGAAAVPAFRDPHLHLLAMAAERLSVDCSADRAPNLDALLDILGAAADQAAPGTWIRATGYDEALLAERRHPTRDELDRVAPDRPLVLRHRSGHLAVLNRTALHAIGRDGSDPVIVGPAALDGLTPRLDAAELRRALATVGAELAAAGLVSVTDATATNDLDRIEFLAAAGLPVDVAVLPSARALDDVVAAGIAFGDDAGRVRVLQAKVMPEPADVRGSVGEQVAAARAHGWPVAVHAVDVDEVEATLAALERVPPPAAGSDRIEHLGLALPEHVARLAAARVTVVTQPAFLARRGRKYLDEVSAVEQPWLYRVRSLLAAGVVVAASSDAPVVPARPLDAVAAAVRRTVSGTDGVVIGPEERVDRATALRLVTAAPAALYGSGGGALRPGAVADFCVLDADPRDEAVDPETIRVLATVRRGHPSHLDPVLLEP